MFLWGVYVSLPHMKVSFIQEYENIERLLLKLPKVDALNTLVLNVSPDYSSIVTQRVLHHLSSGGELPHLEHVDVPYPGERAFQYQNSFWNQSERFPFLYDKIILCEAAVLSGKNYTWIQNTLYDRGYEKDDIISIALYEMSSSIFKSDYVGEYCEEIPDFYWERENRHW